MRKLLEDHPRGDEVLAQLDEGKMPDDHLRQRLVRIVVADLVDRGGRGL